jgi:hypothetical protein
METTAFRIFFLPTTDAGWRMHCPQDCSVVPANPAEALSVQFDRSLPSGIRVFLKMASVKSVLEFVFAPVRLALVRFASRNNADVRSAF